MPKTTHKYSNNELTVIWKPGNCIHSKVCWTNLKQVFDPTRRPWIDIAAATAEAIIAQVKQCPSGALSYEMNESIKKADEFFEKQMPIKISPNGPVLIKTACIIEHSNGSMEEKAATVALCRCGASANKPYCDGSHSRIGFEG
jgi:uncharacterized Fe-S cluster protein YjdI